MARVAYLIGVSGSWKTFIGKQLPKAVKVIKADSLRDKAVNRLFSHNKPRGDEWERCDHLLGNPGLPGEFSAILSDLQLSDDRPILAEGISLGHDRWREAFRTALASVGITIAPQGERLFWIHPPPEVVWHNRLHRDRRGQRAESLDEVRQHCETYHKWVQRHSSFLYKDPDEVTQAIKEFLLSSQ